MKKPCCQSCWLFGDPSAMQKEWVNGVSGNPNKFGVKIKSHEKPQSQLDASIAFGRWKAGQRINRVQEQAIATEATFWRKCLLRIINMLMTLAMMSLALRGQPRGRWRLSRWKVTRARGDASAVPVLQDLPISTPQLEIELSEREYPKRTDSPHIPKHS